MIQVLITGPQPLYRQAVVNLLAHHQGLRSEQALDPQAQPSERLSQLDLLVVCASADADDSELIQRLGGASRLSPGKVVLFCENLGKRHQNLMDRGVIDLCLPLSITLEQALYCLERLLSEGRSQIVRQMRSDTAILSCFYPDLHDLTRSERQVLLNLQQGLSNQAIADRMDICLNTAKVHLARVCRKAGFRNRNQAAGFNCALLAIEQALI